MTSKMLREIREQPRVLQRILDEEWGKVRDAARALRDADLHSVVIVARGTSDNAALYAKYLFEVLLGIPTALASPSAFTVYKARMKLDKALVMGISQSGESKDVFETVRRAREFGARTVSLTNDESSPLAQVSEAHLCLRAGNEESVAATKTYTAELMLLYLLTIALRGEERPDASAKRLPEQARRVLEAEWRGTARYRYAEHLVVVSRGYNLATAKEAALKLMETAYMVAEAFSGADLKHGPIAMISKDFPVVAVIPPGKARASIKALVENLSDRGAELVVIGEEGLTDGASASFVLPLSCPEELSPILYVLPLQMLAHDLSCLRGLNPDAPRGLSKVTETW